MLSIILCCSDKAKTEALAAGFKEESVLIKRTACQSTEENKHALEQETKKLRPYQFLVSDYWGMCVD